MKNKKLIATVASLCLVVVAVVAAVVGVLAAANQTVKGTLSVQYQANDVSAVVTLSKKAEGATPDEYSATDSHTFAKTDAQSSETLTIAQETLTSSVKYVVYKFTFQNTNTSYAMTVTPTYTATETSGKTDLNVTVRYQLLDDGATTAATLPNYGSGETVTNTANLGTAMTSLAAFDVAQSSTRILYVVVAITDINADAQYLLAATTADGNTLSFALARKSA